MVDLDWRTRRAGSPPVKRGHQGGQATTEFLLVAGAIAVALFYPYLGGESVGSLLLRAVLRSIRARAFLISIL